MRHLFSLAAVSLGATLATPAQANLRGAGEAAFEVASGKPVRWRRSATTKPAPHQARAASRLAAAGLPRTMWDAATGVVLRAWGAGERVPGAVADPTIAAAAARRVDEALRAELAPGTAAGELVLAGNAVVGGVRTVGFSQHHGGLPVLGGQVSVSFRADRIVMVSSQALPDVAVAQPRRAQRSVQVAAAATAWLDRAIAGGVRAGTPGPRVILPLVRGPGDITYRVVDVVDVHARAGAGRWDVYVDAITGDALGRRSTLYAGTGVVRYRVPDRHPLGTFSEVPAAHAAHVVDSSPTIADAAGAVTWTGALDATVSPGLTSAEVTIVNEAGPRAQASLTLPDAGSVTWEAGADELVLAQLSAFIHATQVKAHARAFGYPLTSYLDQPVSVHVNEDGACNAYSNGDDIHFYPRGFDGELECANTGAMADVVFHEYGHSLHIQGIVPGAGQFDSAVSEALADVLAALITGDSGMGRGFFLNDEPLRELDPAGDEATWPQDESFDPHLTGLILGGAMWDLRTQLLATTTPEQADATLHAILWGLMARATDIPSTLVEALVSDDDDGDLTNGTPHECLIREAFGRHGLDEMGVDPIGAPRFDGLAVTVPVTPVAPTGACPATVVTGAVLRWQLAADATVAGEVALDAVDGGFAGAIPPPATPSVVLAQIDVVTSTGTTWRFPDNLADPHYAVWSGPLFPVWCASFDDEPTTWTTDGGTDDVWQWATPMPGTTSPDPRAPFSGDKVFGTALGLAGRYRPEAYTWAQTPPIDVRGYDGVRLQYRRWLTVEDGFYDQARVVVDETVRWENLVDQGNLHHEDREWRLHDVDLGADAADGTVQVRFELFTDPGFELGGWTLDDVCVMAAGGAGPPPTCGDAVVAGAETCDDGNTDADDGCSPTCEVEVDGGCCGTGTSPAGPLVLAGFVLLGMSTRRRRGGVVRRRG